MKNKPFIWTIVAVFLSSCVIINPIYPQDELDLTKYQPPIELDWATAGFLGDGTTLDDEELRACLNSSRSVIKIINEQANVFYDEDGLRIGSTGQNKDGILSFELKNTFLADAIALRVRPYYQTSLSMFDGSTTITIDDLSVSIDEREFLTITMEENKEATLLTFAFPQSISTINIKTENGRGMFLGLSIYQKL